MQTLWLDGFFKKFLQKIVFKTTINRSIYLLNSSCFYVIGIQKSIIFGLESRQTNTHGTFLRYISRMLQFWQWFASRFDREVLEALKI